MPPTRERSGAPRRGPDNAPPQAPGMRGFRDIAADADDLGRATAQANRNARKTYANVPSPSPEFDRLEPSMENRGADPDAPYSYDESVEEAERYAPSAQPPQPPSRSHLTQDREQPKKQRPHRRGVPVQERDRGRRGADPGRRRHTLGQVGGDDGRQPVQVVPGGRSAEGPVNPAVEAEDSRPGRPAVVDRAGCAGGAARGAV